MTEQQQNIEIMGFRPVDIPALWGLPDTGHEQVLIAVCIWGFEGFPDGDRNTVVTDAASADMLALGADQLEGGFAGMTTMFHGYRHGWFPEWETPEDGRGWVMTGSAA